jgi:hypothetical protein
MTKRTLDIEAETDFDRNIQAIIDRAVEVVCDHPNGARASDRDFAVMVANKLALWLNAAHDKARAGGSGYTNYATKKAAHILSNYKTHYDNATDAVNLTMAWDDEKEVVIPKIMSWVKGYFGEIADWNMAQSYEMPGAAGQEKQDFKKAVSEMYNVGIDRVNWREIAEGLHQDWLENRGDGNE